MSLESIPITRVASLKAKPPYEGLLIYDPGWWGISMLTAEYAKASYKDQGNVFAVTWVYTSWRGDITYQILFRIGYEANEYTVYALMGMSAEEPFWAPIALEPGGRWFLDGETDAIILPTEALTKLKASVGEKVRMLNKELRVIGSFNAMLLDQVTDLNGEKITPIDWRTPELMHISAADLAIIPYDLSLELGGAMIAYVNIIPRNSSLVNAISAEILSTLRFITLVSGFDDQIVYHYLTETVYAFGWQMQIVPLTLGSLIIFNLLLGGVKEHERDIFIYSSVGLSPLHIAFLFLAESMLYAVLGSVLGYAISVGAYQILSTLVSGFPQMNYSSMSVVSVLGIIMFMTIMSTIYPAIKASKIVTPSLERAWKIRGKPTGDTWEIPLPVLIESSIDLSGVLKYLMEFLAGQVGETGKFSTEEVQFREKENFKGIDFIARLAPYDQGIRQQASITCIKDPSMSRWAVTIVLRRISGNYEIWTRLVRGFVDEIRKQFIIWKTMSPKEKERYMS